MVWEIAALVRTESSLLTTDTLAVILVAGITKIDNLTYSSFTALSEKEISPFFFSSFILSEQLLRLVQCDEDRSYYVFLAMS